jgi:NAD(P)-dependent dehydrogenase (short-subunit alcohol dehydrogenase family)
MKNFKGRVAVITGAASGIGFGLAERCAQEGMKVVLADIEEETLVTAEDSIKSKGVSTLAVRTDVSKAEDVRILAEKTVETFGGVHLLFNNAGVDAKFTVRESTLDDWQWVLGVDLWGIIHGINIFTPYMIKQDTESHIVNTASMAGLFTDWCGSPYTVSKHAVVAISEILYRELHHSYPRVGVSVLCPGSVNTHLTESARNRPIEFKNSESKGIEVPDPNIQAHIKALMKLNDYIMSPQEVADITFTSILNNEFYILPNAEFVKMFVKTRMEDILQGRNPTIVPLE